MADAVEKSPRSSRRNKAPGAFRTISEVATVLEVPQHVLRFWESKFTQVRPLKRGGGRRYYRPEDIDLLRGIRHLLYSDRYTIKGVQKLLRERGPKPIMESGRRLAGRKTSGETAEVTTKKDRKDEAALRSIPNSLQDPSLLEPSQAGGGHEVDRRKNLGLTSSQRQKLKTLAAELGRLKVILRQACKD